MLNMNSLKKYWFYWASLLRLCYDISGLAVTGVNLRSMTLAPQLKHTSGTSIFPQAVAFASLTLATWTFSCVNGLFLMLYDTRYSHSIFGSLLVQQGISVIIVAPLLGGLYLYAEHEQDNVGFTPKFPTSYVQLAAVSGGFTLLISVVLLAQTAVLAGRLKLPVSSYWFANAGDLSMNTQIELEPPTWRGFRRRAAINSVPHGLFATRCAFELGQFAWNSLFRRVSPVETIPYAIFQNVFGLAAVTLIMVRIVSLLTQLQNEDFLTRTETEVCPFAGNISVLVGYTDDRYTDSPLDEATTPHSYHVRILKATSGNMYSDVTDSDKCKYAGAYRSYNTADRQWYRRYDCGDPRTVYPIEYVIAPRNTTTQTRVEDYPRLWFTTQPGDGTFPQNDPRINSVPYMSQALQLSPGNHVVSGLTQTKRRFIVSSGIHDAITGLKPRYLDVNFFPWTQISSVPISPDLQICTSLSADLNAVACGYVWVPAGLKSHPTATQRQLNQKADGRYCQVIEDYRQGSMFDFLGSIGGLLALLQGVHIFLFGRPLFWGMFGAKLLTPFGFVGQFASQTFRQRLQEHYHIQGSRSTDLSDEDTDPSNTIRMTRFLLDYVLDMGPASVTRPNARQDDIESSYSAVELSGVQQDHANLADSSDASQRPLLTVDQSGLRPLSLENITSRTSERSDS